MNNGRWVAGRLGRWAKAKTRSDQRPSDPATQRPSDPATGFSHHAACCAPRVERIGGSPSQGGGKSELRRAAGWITSRRGDATESATENKPPIASAPQGSEEEVRVKRCGKSAPRPARAWTARQTPCGARPNREVMEPPVSVMSFRVGCLTTAVTRVADE
jgi:hypothetical protein